MLVSLISRLVACSPRIVVDKQTNRHTDGHTHRTTTVTLAAHARRGLISILFTIMALKITNLYTCTCRGGFTHIRCNLRSADSLLFQGCLLYTKACITLFFYRCCCCCSHNQHKSEVICEARSTREYILSSIPGASVIASSDACLLGSPIGDIESVSSSIAEKIRPLGIMGERLQHLDAHIAILLLCPKLLYTLRTSPCFLSPNLALYDDRLRSIVGAITNINFEPNTPAWTQVSLPVKYGGLGFRRCLRGKIKYTSAL